MQRAQEKFAQAQQYYMTAQIMRQADNSGLLHGAPQSGPLAASAVGGIGAAAPHSPSKPLSGLLQTDGSDVTQCATRHDHSLSAVAQSYMSTQNTSGVSTPSPPAPACTASSLCPPEPNSQLLPTRARSALPAVHADRWLERAPTIEVPWM